MNELRFDGKTVIVTGAGGNPSLGRAHALLFGSRGANVVVNDIDAKHAPSASTAKSVAEEIVAAGGKAIHNNNSVATEAGAQAIVKAAMEAFGGVDILVNNAGVIYQAAMTEISPADFQRVIDVNLMGPAWMTRAVWDHMKGKGYGRIVNITSGSMYGFALQASYAASKGGLYSFTRATAAEGERYGILANAVSPAGFTRMVIGGQEEDCPSYQASKNMMKPEQVSPVVAYLSHESCTITGECIEAMGPIKRRVYMAATKGIMDPDDTIEHVVARWDEIMDGASDQRVPYAMMDGYNLHSKTYEPDNAKYEPAP
jgi:NAD(P)-dependent dehydrogenase (short-subunit alcohol dehydrogenase family)